MVAGVHGQAAFFAGLVMLLSDERRGMSAMCSTNQSPNLPVRSIDTDSLTWHNTGDIC